MGDPRNSAAFGSGPVRDHHKHCDRTGSSCRIRGDLERFLRHKAQNLGPAPEHIHASVRVSGCYPGVSHALLESGRRGTGSDRCAHLRGLHDPFGRQTSQLGRDPLHDRLQPFGRRPVGRHSGVLQGALEHERDAVHSDDELCRHAARGLLLRRLGVPQGLGTDRHHQPEHTDRMVSADRLAEVSSQYPDRRGRLRADVRVSQLLQARL